MTSPANVDPVPVARYRPADLPGLRRDMIRDCLFAGPPVYRQHLQARTQSVLPPDLPDGVSVDAAAEHLVGLETAGLTRADLFYVAPDMTALALVAGQDLPDFVLDEDDLPAPAGLLLFDGPIPQVYDEPFPIAGRMLGRDETPTSPVHICAVAWTPVCDHRTGDRGWWFSLYTDRDLGDEECERRGLMTPEVLRAMRPHRARLVHDNEALLMFGCEWADLADDPERFRVGVPVIRALLAATLLMQQPLAETLDGTSEAAASRAERRRLHREGLGADRVTLVRLRRPKHARRDPDDDRGHVDWSCRWPVRGHWRLQAYGPGRTGRRPTYIQPFIKGPDDRPLRTRERVVVWDR